MFFSKAKLLVCVIFCLSFILVKSKVKKGKNFERHFVIFSAGRNTSKWYKKHFDSIFNQEYENYHIVYIDDCSDDGTGELVAQYTKEKGMEHKVTLIINEERKYKMTNQFYAIYEFCKDSDIVVELDSDDWFTGNDVLPYLNEVYSDPQVWLAYSSARFYPSGKHRCFGEIPEKVAEKNSFRTYGFKYGGLRTYYAGLFKLIKKEDFIYNGKCEEFKGKLRPISSDHVMFPMMEMAREGHYRFVKKPLKVLNREVSRRIKYPKKLRDIKKELHNKDRHDVRYSVLKEPVWEIN